MTTLNSVVLPEPLGPMSPAIAPCVDRERAGVERDDPAEGFSTPYTSSSAIGQCVTARPDDAPAGDGERCLRRRRPALPGAW